MFNNLTLLSLILSYGMYLSLVTMVMVPWKPSCLRVSAHATDAGPPPMMRTFLFPAEALHMSFWRFTFVRDFLSALIFTLPSETSTLGGNNHEQ